MRFMFEVELSDPTGSLVASLSSSEMEGFIGMGAEEFSSHGKEDRAYFLDLCVYRGVIVRLKSERLVGGVKHRAVSATKSNHKRSLDQIKAIAIEEKTKYVNSW